MSRPRANEASDAQIVAAYKKYRAIQKAADSLGIGATTLHRVLKRCGIERTGLQEYRKKMSAPKRHPYIGVYKGSTKQILKWYADGKSLKEIAKRIGRSVHVVHLRVKRAGISRPWRAKGRQHSMWNGGRHRDGGYWKVWIPDSDPMIGMRGKARYVKEHRLVLARKLGRPLLSTETVHHIDGNGGNNDPSNLELRQGKHGRGVAMCCLDCGSRNIGHAKLEQRPRPRTRGRVQALPN